MLVPLAVFLFYLAAIPVHCALKLDSRGVSVGVSIFVRQFAVQNARPIPHSQRKKHKKPPILLFLRAMRAFIAHLHPSECAFTGAIGIGDAASTALVCGVLGMLDRSLHPVAPCVRIQIAPDFSQSGVQITGILSARAGNIMLAALFGAQIYLSGRIQTWKSTRLKAS